MHTEAGLPDTGPPLKRSRLEAKVCTSEGEPDLMDLLTKRPPDVKQLLDRISTLESELEEARSKLKAGEDLLAQIRKVHGIKIDIVPATNIVQAMVKKEPADPSQGTGPSLQNGHIQKKPTAPSPARINLFGSSKSSTPDVHGFQALSNQNNDVTAASSRSPLTTSTRNPGALPNTSIKSRSDNTPGRSMLETGKIDKRIKEPSGEDMTKKEAKPVAPRREAMDLVKCIRSNSKATPLTIQLPYLISSRHKRKLRSLELNPSSDHQCATSALDGVVNFWQIDPKGKDLNFRMAIDCLSPKSRHWPEDLAWHPDGHSVFSVYSADKGDCQVAILKNQKKKDVVFLPEKPHDKGILNAIVFMPWSNSHFVTGGCDHGVVLWSEKDSSDVWQPTVLHKNLHSSAVYGVAGLMHRDWVVSAGVDKRVIMFDPKSRRKAQTLQLESKVMGVSPNPVDANLYMVHTATLGQQLLLFDVRSGGTRELHKFGWHQDATTEMTALISQSWSPDGLYAASGSVDPKIHIYDIRYNSKEPTQTIKAHQKRVFKAAWHHSLPLLISISSDLNLGLHNISQ